MPQEPGIAGLDALAKNKSPAVLEQVVPEVKLIALLQSSLAALFCTQILKVHVPELAVVVGV